MPLSLNTNTLLLSLLTGGVGTVLLVYGKKQQRWPHIAAGILLMVYPYFVESLVASLAIAAIIGAGLWWAVKAGW